MATIAVAVAVALWTLSAAAAPNVNVVWSQSGPLDLKILRSMTSVYATASPSTRKRLHLFVMYDDAVSIDRVKRLPLAVNITYLYKPVAALPVQPRVWGYGWHDARLDKLASPGNYWRFFLPSLLPSEEKVLYLDTDTLVLSDVGHVYDRALQSERFVMAAGMQSKRNCWFSRLIDLRDKRLKAPEYDIDPSGACLTSSAMLIHIPRWNARNISAMLWHVVAMNAEQRLYALGSLPPLMIVMGQNWEMLPETDVRDMKAKSCCDNIDTSQACILHPVKYIRSLPSWMPNDLADFHPPSPPPLPPHAPPRPRTL